MNSEQDKIDQARQAIQEERFDDAIKIYGDIINSEADDLTYYQTYQDLGYLYYEHKKYDDSIYYLNLALGLDFDDDLGRIHRILGFSHIQKGTLVEAVPFLEESLQLQSEKNTEYFICKYELGKAHFHLNELEEAMGYFAKCEPFFKETQKVYYASVLYFSGLIRFMQKETEVASDYFKSIINHSGLTDMEKLNGYFGQMFIANVNKDGDELIRLAGKILEVAPKFYDKETLTFFTLKAYQYQSRELEYEHLLDLFISDYPDGKYSDQYDELNNYEFKRLID